MASDRHLARLKEGAAAWNRWRREEPLVRPDLQGLSLTLAQKQWGETSGGPINFAQSMLREADLRYATLIDADLVGATLIGADLSGARLRNADLRNANLAHARFDGADLAEAHFSGANLSGADLSGARNLSFSQIEAAEGDAKTLLPQQLVTPSLWRNGGGSEGRVPVSAEALRATAEAYFPSVLRSQRPPPESDPHADRFAQALHGLSRPRFDAVADRARRTLNELPRPRLDGVADRAKAALQGVPRPKLAALVDRAKRAVQRIPRPQPASVAQRAGRALSGLPHRRAIVIASAAGLLVVIALGGLLALRGLANRGMDAAPHDASSPAVVAETRAVPQTQSAPSVPAPTLVRVSKPIPQKEQEPPQRLTVSEESAATTAVEDVGGMRDTLTVGDIEEHPRMVEAKAAPLATSVPEGGALTVGGVDAIEVHRSQPPTAVQDLSDAPAHSADALVRLAFATRAEDAVGTPGKSIDAPMVASPGEAPVESYVGQPVTARAIEDTMKRTDLPKPTTLAKAHVPEAPQAPHSPISVVDYLSMPDKSSDWIKGFIKDYYLSGTALEDADLRRIYSHRVEYFGKHKTSINEVAREQARYYREWPHRHYELVPGSIAIKWKADKIADVSFTYRYEVSASDKRTSKGRGRAHLTLDLRGHTGLITREDGEVIAHK